MKNTPTPSLEPLHRRTLAPIIQAQVEAIRAESTRRKTIILAMPDHEQDPWIMHELRYIEAREEAELMKEVFRLIEEKPMNESAVDDAIIPWAEHLTTQKASRT